MQIHIQLDEAEVKKLIEDHIQSLMGEVKIDKSKIIIETKSKQNFRSEWESAAFRATYNSLMI